MRARRPLLYFAAILGAAAWLVLHDRSAPPDLVASRKTNEPSPPPPLADAVSAERTKEPLAAKVDPANDGAKIAPADAAQEDPRAKSRDFWIRLFDETDGSPIADAQCCVGPYDFELFQTASLEWGAEIAVRTHFGSMAFAEMAQWKSRSGGDGFAMVPIAAGRALVVSVVAEGFIPAYFFANERGQDPRGGGHGDRERALEVGLSRAASLEGTVLREGGQPLAGADVALHFMHEELRRPRSNFESMLHQRAQTQATTDASGHFQFAGLPADVAIALGVTEAEATAPLDETELWLDPGEHRVFAWIVGGSAWLRGRVVDGDAAPVAAAEVSVGDTAHSHCFRTLSAADGGFELESHQIGDVTLCVGPQDGRHAGMTQQLHLAAGERRDDLVVVLPAAAPLIVRAIDRDGNALPLGQARAWSSVNRRSYVDSNQSEAEGQRGSIHLVGVPLGDLIVRVDQFAAGSMAGAEVPFHHDGARDCVVTLDAGATLNVTVVAAADRAPVRASATLLRRDRSSGFAFLYMMGSMASPSIFLFGGLAAGTYDVVAESDDGQVGVLAGVALAAGEAHADVVVEVARAATLELTAPAASDLLPADRRFTFEVRRGDVGVGTTGAPLSGRAHLNVPPGRLTVELRAGRDLVATLQVDARAGQLTRVRF